MATPPKRARFIHAQYWAVSPYFGSRPVTAAAAREAWKAADRVDGTAEFGFRTAVDTDQHRSTLESVFLPMTGYALPARLEQALAAGEGALACVEQDAADEAAEPPARVRLRHRAARRLGLMALALALVATATACASLGKGGSGRAGAPKGGYGCKVPPGADAFASCCKVGTEAPKVAAGVVHGAAEASCTEPPEYYALTVFLYRAASKAHAHPGAWTEVDVCTQDDPADVGLGGAQGVRCAVATSCVPGYYVTAWDIDVSIDGAAGAGSDDTGYGATITKAQCRA